MQDICTGCGHLIWLAWRPTLAVGALCMGVLGLWHCTLVRGDPLPSTHTSVGSSAM